MIYLTLLFFIVSIIIIADHCCRAMILSYLPLYNQRSIEKFMKVSPHNTIAKYINMYSIFVTLISV